MSLYESLVKLGAQRKDLRPHIRPVLSHIRSKYADYEYGGSLFRNEHERSKALLYDFLTAQGRNSSAEALEFLSEGSRANLQEMKMNMDVDRETLEYIKRNWRDLAADIEDELRRGMHSHIKTAAGESLFETISEFCNELAKVSQKIMRKEPSVVAHRPGSSPNCSMTHKGDRTRYTISYGVDATNVDDVKVVIQYMNGEQVMEEETMPGAMEPTDVAEEACDKMLVLMGAGEKTASRRCRQAGELDSIAVVDTIGDMLNRYLKRGGWWQAEPASSMRGGAAVWTLYPKEGMLSQAMSHLKNREMPQVRVSGVETGDSTITVQVYFDGMTIASEQARRPPSFTGRTLKGIMPRLLEAALKDLNKWTGDYINSSGDRLARRRRTAGVEQDIRKITQMANRHNMMVDLDTSRGTITVTPDEPSSRRDRESFLNWMHSRYELEPVEDWGRGAVEFAYFD